MNVHQEVEYLREENRQLKDALGAVANPFPKEWKLTKAEQRLLSCLATGQGGFRKEEALRAASSHHESSDRDLVKVRVSQMRKKLKPFGVEIRNVWGEGYELPEVALKEVKKHLTEIKSIFRFGGQSAHA